MLSRTENLATAALSFDDRVKPREPLQGYALKLGAADTSAKTHPVFHLNSSGELRDRLGEYPGRGEFHCDKNRHVVSVADCGSTSGTRPSGNQRPSAGQRLLGT